ncbi:MAG: serine/threonine-protein kinase [Actinomycetota bacterium]
MSASTPTVIAGRYELQRRLAQGGMAEVWLAIDLSLDRKVAVKWLKPNLATDEIVAERFRREAVAAASLDHPNIVAVHDVFEQDGRQAVVMQLVEGKSLRQLLDAQKRLSPELTCHIGTAVAAALDHAHDAGFVHRDVKPANIMITPDGRVLLTDFGIAKGLHGDGSDDLTSDNIMMGTAKYLSPEQVRGKKLDGRADLYSLGLVLYECLAGRVPFLGETDADTALARLQRDPTDLAQLRATLPRRLVDTIHDLLARNPDRRHESGAALIDDLETAREEGPPEIDPTEPGEERSPVAPFSAGRLVRAPSDLRGRAADRGRAVRGSTPPHGKQSRSSRRSPSTPTPRPDAHDGANASAASDHRDRRGPRPSPAAAGSVDGTARIPGQPEHITGTTPTTRAAASPVATHATPSTRVPTQRPVRRDDPTPTVGQKIHAPPARGLGQDLGVPRVVLGGLVGIALVVLVVVFLTVNFGGDGDTTAPDSVLPAQDDDLTDTDTVEPIDEAATDPGLDDGGATIDEVMPSDPLADASAELVEDPVPATIEAVRTFDPDGDGTEEDDLVDNVTDGDSTTSWRTSCYSNQWMGGKRGVGLVVTLDVPDARGLSVDVAHSPSLVQFYASDATTVPATFEAWGEPLGDSAANTDAATVVSPTAPDSTRHLMVVIQQLGPRDGCSETNPLRGELTELRLTG